MSDYLGSSSVVNANTTKEFFATHWLPYFNSPIIANTTFYNNKTIPFKSLKGYPFAINIFTSYSNGRILFSTQDSTIYFVNVITWLYDKNGNNTGVAVYNDIAIVLVDIKGEKEPNIIGKDAFWFRVDFNKNIVQPYCYNNSMGDINDSCSKIRGDGYCCAAKIIKDGWQIKDDYPW